MIDILLFYIPMVLPIEFVILTIIKHGFLGETQQELMSKQNPTPDEIDWTFYHGKMLFVEFLMFFSVLVITAIKIVNNPSIANLPYQGLNHSLLGYTTLLLCLLLSLIVIFPIKRFIGLLRAKEPQPPDKKFIKATSNETVLLFLSFALIFAVILPELH
ncbi:MAG: hypothetical protein GY928_33945 [Colwellia sp.]|nr:hypothetical protein [Colwellia sp.]